MPTPTTTPPSTTRAPARVPRRLVAYLFDVIAVSLVIVVVAAALSLILGPALRFDLANDDPAARVLVAPGRTVVDVLVATLLSAVYFAGSWWRMGATVGQLLLGIGVVPSANAARTVEPGAALLRWIVMIPPFGILSVLAADVPGSAVMAIPLGAIWALVLLVSSVRRADRRGLHDRAAGTRVLRVDRRSAVPNGAGAST
jgi:uncharacterized RDD family membrane protein YckC